jgi:type IV secretion system protein VirD4
VWDYLEEVRLDFVDFALKEEHLKAWGMALVVTAVTLFAGSFQTLVHPIALLALPIVAVAASGLASRKDLEVGSSHGSARWGDPHEVFPTRDGLILGTDEGGDLLFAPPEGHLLTVAPTGAGKGVGAVLPNLLWHMGSLVVTDPKGENFAVSGAARRSWGEVCCLDPFRVTGGVTAAINPIDRIAAAIGRDQVGDAYERAMQVASSLVVPREGGDSFWDEEAQALLAGLILGVGERASEAAKLGDAGEWSLVTVRQWLNRDVDGWRQLAAELKKSRLEQVVAAISRFEAAEERVRSSIKTTAQSHTHFLDSPQIRATLERSTFEPGALKQRPMTLYLVLPPDKLGTYGRWLRLVVGSLLHEMTSGPKGKESVLFLLDEFAQLGRMRSIEQAISLIRGYGVRLWLLVQDLSQLRGLYGQRWETMVANVQVLQAFGTNDPGTAEYLSKRLGQGTIRVESQNVSQGASTSPGRWGTSSSRNKSVGEQATGRPLLYPDEVARLDRCEQLLICPGQRPLKVPRLNYLDTPFFVARADANPHHIEEI